MTSITKLYLPAFLALRARQQLDYHLQYEDTLLSSQGHCHP